MKAIVRESKFRHVFGEVQKEKYEDLRIGSKQTESTGVRGNSKFFCFPWESGGGGTLAVLPISKYGRMPRDIPLITGHSGPILDFEFNPFDDNMLMSCAEDNMVKLWQIPEGGFKAHQREALATLEGHGKKVSFCTFNQSADGIVASTSFDLTTKVWDLSEQAEALSVAMPEVAMHLKWNYPGSLLAATCKDKKLRIIDPRANKFAAEVKAHDGTKSAKVEWMGSTSSTDANFMLVTTGFTSQAERQIGVWDMRKFGQADDATEPLNMLNLDNGTGALLPFFDPGTQLLFVAGKGDANVRYFEAVATDPYMHFVDVFSTTVPQKAFDFLPKRCVDVSKHEIMRGIKLEASSGATVSFKVPRKSEAFQEDLFPDCVAGVPAMSAGDWVSGAEAKEPVLRSMRPGEAEKVNSPVKTAGGAGVVSMKDLKKELAEAQARIVALEKENELLKAELAQLKGS